MAYLGSEMMTNVLGPKDSRKILPYACQIRSERIRSVQCMQTVTATTRDKVPRPAIRLVGPVGLVLE